MARTILPVSLCLARQKAVFGGTAVRTNDHVVIIPSQGRKSKVHFRIFYRRACHGKVLLL